MNLGQSIIPAFHPLFSLKLFLEQIFSETWLSAQGPC